jgi:hypothetical protein
MALGKLWRLLIPREGSSILDIRIQILRLNGRIFQV